ncbi:MAG: TolC family protein [Candidatus Aminicenantales bacterium]
MHRKIAIFSTLILFLLGTAWSQESGKALSLTLEDCLLRAMKKNLNIAVEVLSPELSAMSLSRSKEKYYPSFSFSYNQSSTNEASYSWIDAAGNVAVDSNDFTAQVSQETPLGGRFSVSIRANKYDTNRNFQTINPRYGSRLTFSFSQPLLRDFGININRREIIIAKNNLEISEIQLNKTIQDTVYNVIEAYWNLVYSIDSLKVKRQSLELARDLLAKNKRSVEIGTLAPIEILSAESEVATREADILQAEALVKNNEDRLKNILNLTDEEEKEISEIIALDKPQFTEREVTLEQALATALEKRPELQASRTDLKNQEVNLSYTKNQLLPNLSLTASYWSPGVSGTQIIYADPFSQDVTQIIPRGAADAIKDTLDFKYKNWSVGLTLDIPLSNFLSRAAYAQAKISLDQALLRLENQEKQVFLEIKNAVRAVQTDFKRVHAYKVARELAEKKLEAEEEKLRVGLSTNYFVLTYQRELANARSAELKAIVDYNLSKTNLERAMGTILEARNIKFSG